MTSLVTSLKQRLSLDSRQSTPRTAGSMPSSPSFSDFSLGAENEAEYELWKAKSRKTLDHARREEPDTKDPAWAVVIGTSTPRDIPNAQGASGSVLGQSRATPKRRPEGKIHGMSYYDYHDIIRSASL